VSGLRWSFVMSELLDRFPEHKANTPSPSRNDDEAIRVMQRATAIPKNTRVNYHDHVCCTYIYYICVAKFMLTTHSQSLPVQARLFKSLKLWSLYVDLEESIGTVETTKSVYDKILELRIANAQIIVNYALFLEENQYFEDSFRVCVL